MIYTIGHSTLNEPDFLNLLIENRVDLLIDIRSFPASRTSPHFRKDYMERNLILSGIDYLHLPDLGGRRSIQKEVDRTLNAGWNNRSFRNYADWTRHAKFTEALNTVIEHAGHRTVCLMCCERHPSQCHRSIVSDYLTFKGHEVTHILGEKKTARHKHGQWGAVPVPGGAYLEYPASISIQVEEKAA